jgi:hypothetical protein
MTPTAGARETWRRGLARFHDRQAEDSHDSASPPFPKDGLGRTGWVGKRRQGSVSPSRRFRLLNDTRSPSRSFMGGHIGREERCGHCHRESSKRCAGSPFYAASDARPQCERGCLLTSPKRQRGLPLLCGALARLTARGIRGDLLGRMRVRVLDIGGALFDLGAAGMVRGFMGLWLGLWLGSGVVHGLLRWMM